MERDERDSTGWPEQDASASEIEPTDGGTRSTDPDPDSVPGADADAGLTPPPPPPSDDDTSSYAVPDEWSATPESAPSADSRATSSEDAAPAEIESWPSQDAAADTPVTTASDDAWSADPAAHRAAEAAWPTEPPVAGSATGDAWPTSPPERGGEPILEPSPAPIEPPPSEVEAYPASPTATDGAAVVAAPGPAHSVPSAETATGESTQCPRCGTENRPGLAFCRNCGQRLVAAGVAATIERPGTPEGTQACPRCGTHNRAGVAFCQNCGANLRGTAAGYVPPAGAGEDAGTGSVADRRGAILGPVVLLIGLVGIVTGYLLPFAYGTGSLFERAFGASGYGAAFWSGYPDVAAGLADQAYFGLAAPAPVLAALLLALAVAGFARAVPGMLQGIGLGIALLWSVGLVVLFLVVEVAGSWGGDIVGLLRDLTPAGIIFFLSGLIIIIGSLTRFGRS